MAFFVLETPQEEVMLRYEQEMVRSSQPLQV